MAAALLAQAMLHGWFAASHSPTFDETGFLAAGLEVWTTSRDHWMLMHPPLAKWIYGLAETAAGPGHAVLGARLATASGALALTAVVAAWAAAWWGPTAGVLAAWLLALEPNVLAHGALATTDLWLTLWVVSFARLAAAIAAGTGGRFSREAAGVLAGLALGSKVSAVGFLPAVTVAAAATAGPGACRRLAGAAPRILVPAAAVLLVVFTGQLDTMAVGLRWVARYGGEGVPAFFFGALRTGRLPAYFPAVFALKVPLALSGLALAAAVAGWRRPAGRRVRLVLALLAAIVAPVMGSRLHLGLRHILPTIPFTVLLAAAWLAGPPRRGRFAVAVLALGWEAVALARCGPHFLASFNELAGGPGGGWRYVADSNLDWGQDLPALAAWCRANRVTRLPLVYFGTADPVAYGVPVVPWREGDERRNVGGFVAISVSYLDGTLTGDLERFGWFRSREPVARPGWSIHVYALPGPGQNAARTTPTAK